MFSSKTLLGILFLSLCLAACAQLAVTPTFTPTVAVSATRTPVPATATRTVVPSDTQVPATATPLVGVVNIQVNVRKGPSTLTESLGVINVGVEVQIIGRTESSEWYLVLYPQAEEGVGWVFAQYITVGETKKLPVMITDTPTPSGLQGLVTQKVNVRSGPGTEFDILGVLQVNTLVALTGKNETGTWLQIEYPGGPDGRGWLTSEYIQSRHIDELPVLDDSGKPAGTPGATDAPPTPTPTMGPAAEDGDSAADPAVSVAFSPLGVGSANYSSDLSAPTGDGEDWIEFTPYAAGGGTARVTLVLTCTGNGNVQAELSQGGKPLTNWGALTCNGAEVVLQLTAGVPHLLQLSAVGGAGLQFVHYTLVIRNEP